MAIDALKQHQKVYGKNELVFVTSNDTPYSQRNITRHCHNTLEKIGLPKIPFHNLRHTCATLLLQKDVHPKIVQDLLGHASITLTLDTYSHVIPGYHSEAADKLDDIFNSSL